MSFRWKPVSCHTDTRKKHQAIKILIASVGNTVHSFIILIIANIWRNLHIIHSIRCDSDADGLYGHMCIIPSTAIYKTLNIMLNWYVHNSLPFWCFFKNNMKSVFSWLTSDLQVKTESSKVLELAVEKMRQEIYECCTASECSRIIIHYINLTQRGCTTWMKWVGFLQMEHYIHYIIDILNIDLHGV